MKTSQALQSLAALAHESRLNAFRFLVSRREATAGELADALGVAPSTLSFHLKDLRLAGLVDSRRNGRQMVYAANIDALSGLLGFLADDCCGGSPDLCMPAPLLPYQRPETRTMDAPDTDRVYNVLFLCTGNSARSILAEAILNREGKGRFRAFSAGSHPNGTVNRNALSLLRDADYAVDDLRSKSWDEFAELGAPQIDFVFTVCDAASEEVCPIWPGRPTTAHWGIPDPAAATGTPKEIALAFGETYRMLYSRISVFINLPLQSLDRLTLQRRLDEIGQ